MLAAAAATVLLTVCGGPARCRRPALLLTVLSSLVGGLVNLWAELLRATGRVLLEGGLQFGSAALLVVAGSVVIVARRRRRPTCCSWWPLKEVAVLLVVGGACCGRGGGPACGPGAADPGALDGGGQHRGHPAVAAGHAGRRRGRERRGAGDVRRRHPVLRRRGDRRAHRRFRAGARAVGAGRRSGRLPHGRPALPEAGGAGRASRSRCVGWLVAGPITTIPFGERWADGGAGGAGGGALGAADPGLATSRSRCSWRAARCAG